MNLWKKLSVMLKAQWQNVFQYRAMIFIWMFETFFVPPCDAFGVAADCPTNENYYSGEGSSLWPMKYFSPKPNH